MPSVRKLCIDFSLPSFLLFHNMRESLKRMHNTTHLLHILACWYGTVAIISELVCSWTEKPPTCIYVYIGVLVSAVTTNRQPLLTFIDDRICMLELLLYTLDLLSHFLVNFLLNSVLFLFLLLFFFMNLTRTRSVSPSLSSSQGVILTMRLSHSSSLDSIVAHLNPLPPLGSIHNKKNLNVVYTGSIST